MDLGHLFDKPTGLGHKMCRCLCNTFIEEPVTTQYSGIVNYRAKLCRSCGDKYATASRIVCVKCKSLQGFIPPQQTKDGFLFAEGKCYHINGCLHCEPQNSGTQVLEYASYLKKKGIVIKQDLDLVQEIEQKRLQVDSEKAILTAEVKKHFTDT